MEDERKNENPVSSGISLFKILLIVLLIIVVGLLFYMYGKENEVYDDDQYFESSENNDFYYKGVPDRVDVSEVKKKDVEDESNFSSQSKTFEYEENGEEIENKYLEKFNNTLKKNLTLSKAIVSVEDKEEVIYEIINNNAEPICDVDMKVAFFDAEGKLVDIDDVSIGLISANSTAYVSSYRNHLEPFAKCDAVFTKDYSYEQYIECKDAIKYEIKEDEYLENYIVKAENMSNDDVEEAIFFAKYYDAAGNIIHVEDDFISFYDDYEEKDKGFLGLIAQRDEKYDYDNDNEIYFSKRLYDENGEEIPYAKCEVSFYTAYRVKEIN